MAGSYPIASRLTDIRQMAMFLMNRRANLFFAAMSLCMVACLTSFHHRHTHTRIFTAFINGNLLFIVSNYNLLFQYILYVI